NRSGLMSVKTNVLAYTFFKYTPSCVASGRKYVDSCGNKGLDETRRSQTERLISRPRKAEYFSEAMNANLTLFVFFNQCLLLSQPLFGLEGFRHLSSFCLKSSCLLRSTFISISSANSVCS